jgi:hypothetical protein
MKRKIIVLIVIGGMIFFYSCKNVVKPEASNNSNTENTILQDKDGTISLNVDNAECYHDMVNPSSNTAEWNVVVSKSGRFDVWLSSATKDTTNLKYKNKVMLNIHENRLEARPACDRIILNSTDVSYPYYRADSFIGSLYIQDTGLINIQVISEKIIPKNYSGGNSGDSDNSKLLSILFTPTTH